MCEDHPPGFNDLPEGTPLDDTHRVDVLVLGGGWPGLRAAARLAAEGVDVALLEARPRLGAGASARAPGLVAAGLVEHPWRLQNSLGPDAARIHEMSRHGRDALAEVVAHTRGAAWAAVNAREADEIGRSVDTLQRWGVPAARHDDTDARAGGQHFGASWWTPDDVVVDPIATTQRLAQLAIDAGAALHTGTEVRRVGFDHTSLNVELTDGRRVRAEMAVLATESGLPQMDPWFAEALSPVREQALLVSGPGPVHAMRSGYGYTSWVPTDHGLVVAGCRFATPHMEMGEVDDTVTTPAIQERLEASVARFFPHPDREVLARWSWITARGCDGLPLVGPMPGNPAVVVCAGFMGLEGSLGIAAADGVVEGMLTGEARRVPERLAPIRLI